MGFLDVNVADVGTAVGTVGLAFFTFRVVAGDQKDRREREQRELRAQADKVVAWFGDYDEHSPKALRPDDRARAEGIGACAVIRNASGLPVWDVNPTLVAPDGTVITNVPVRPRFNRKSTSARACLA